MLCGRSGVSRGAPEHRSRDEVSEPRRKRNARAANDADLTFVLADQTTPAHRKRNELNATYATRPKHARANARRASDEISDVRRKRHPCAASDARAHPLPRRRRPRPHTASATN
jgi:hypothetical protein